MTGIEPRISGVVSDRSTTVPQPTLLYEFTNPQVTAKMYSMHAADISRRTKQKDRERKNFKIGVLKNWFWPKNERTWGRKKWMPEVVHSATDSEAQGTEKKEWNKYFWQAWQQQDSTKHFYVFGNNFAVVWRAHQKFLRIIFVSTYNNNIRQGKRVWYNSNLLWVLDFDRWWMQE